MNDVVPEADLHVVEVDEIATRYYAAGAGEPLVLLHGGYFGFPDSLDTWSLNLANLAARFRVFALDRVGQGHTGNPVRDSDYTEDFVLQHTIRWLEALGVDSAHLVGHSRGGLLAARLAFALPGFARSAVLVSSASLAPDPTPGTSSMISFYAALGIDEYAGPWTSEYLRREAEANSYCWDHISDAYLGRYLEIAQRPAFAEVRDKMRSGLATNVYLPSLARSRADVLRAIDRSGLPCRTLTVWGADDPSASLTQSGLPLYEHICRHTAVADLHVFNRAGHYVYREQAREFAELVAAFCR